MRTLRSLAGLRPSAVEWELIVIDNGSSDGTFAAVEEVLEAEHFDNGRCVIEETPGLLAGRHRGVRESRGDVLVFVDDDVTFGENWLVALADAFAEPECGLVCARSLPDYECEPPAWLSGLWTTELGLPGGSACYLISVLDFGCERRLVDARYAMGVSYAIRRDLLVELGGFHPDGVPWELRMFRGDGETGVSLTARERGLMAHYEPDVLVHHRVPADRLTMEYLERRSYLQGITQSYTDLRRAAGLYSEADAPHQGVLRTYLWRLRSAVRRGRPTTDPASDGSRGGTLATAFHQGYAYHQEQYRHNAFVEAWVNRPDYWDYSLPAEAALLWCETARPLAQDREP